MVIRGSFFPVHLQPKKGLSNQAHVKSLPDPVFVKLQALFRLDLPEIQRQLNC